MWLLLRAVGIGLFGYLRGMFEVASGRWRRSGPFQSLGIPWIGSCNGAAPQRPEKIDHRDQVADAEDRSACRRHDIENLKLLGIGGVAPRHAEVTEDKLREKSQVEADENNQRRKSRPCFGIKPAGDFG